MKHFYLILPLLVATSVHALTLQEAIKVSIENNPKTVANQLRVQSMEDRLKAQQKNWLPTINISTGVDLNKSSYLSEIRNSQLSSRNRSTSISSSVTLYDGGANRFATQAAEAELRALKARYSSSNALIPNTRGSIARSVIDAYAGLLEVVEQQNYLNFLSATLQIYATAFKGDDLIIIQQQMNDLKTRYIRADFNYKEAVKDFKYFSTVTAPDISDMDTIEQAIASLQIPETAEEAFRIALVKNPNIKMAEYDLESSQANYKSGQARRTAPLIYLQAATSRGAGEINSISNRTNDKSIGVYLSYNFDAKNSNLESAAVKSVEAAQRDLDGEIDETKHTIESVYPSLENQQSLYASQLENLKSADESLNQILEKMKKNNKVDINTALNVLGSHQQYTSQSLAQKISILYTRFNIQRTVGTLFDNLGGLRKR